MRALYLLARIYPLLGLALAVLIADMGLHFRRKNQDYQYYCWFWSGLLLFFILLWVIFRGDLHSDEWVKALFGE